MLQAATPLQPWNSSTNFSGVSVPTVIVGAQNDSIAGVGSHSLPFYNSIPAASEKALVVVSGASHGLGTTLNTIQARTMLVWLKRYVDNDTRFDPFVCPLVTSGAFRTTATPARPESGQHRPHPTGLDRHNTDGGRPARRHRRVWRSAGPCASSPPDTQPSSAATAPWVLRSRTPLEPYERSVGAVLARQAGERPDADLCERDVEGSWRRVSYGQAWQAARYTSGRPCSIGASAPSAR